MAGFYYRKRIAPGLSFGGKVTGPVLLLSAVFMAAIWAAQISIYLLIWSVQALLWLLAAFIEHVLPLIVRGCIWLYERCREIVIDLYARVTRKAA